MSEPKHLTDLNFHLQGYSYGGRLGRRLEFNYNCASGKVQILAAPDENHIDMNIITEMDRQEFKKWVLNLWSWSSLIQKVEI